jgi:hypothetical protein
VEEKRGTIEYTTTSNITKKARKSSPREEMKVGEGVNSENLSATALGSRSRV